jgi:hypothetical protein
VKVVFDPSGAVAEWVAARIPEVDRFGANKAFAVMRSDGEPAAGVVFHDWNPLAGVIEASAAADDPRWATRGVLRTLFGYAYDECACQMVVCRTVNPVVVKLWRAFGADEHVIPRLAGRDRAMTIMTLTDDAWNASKFMEGANGKT